MRVYLVYEDTWDAEVLSIHSSFEKAIEVAPEKYSIKEWEVDGSPIKTTRGSTPKVIK